jgi:hypothetical protein
MFQFPRCPPEGNPPGARPCAGRVAPFGDPRIPGCQRLPGAFRRVAASFLGRQRQGIHHAPFLRRPAAVSSLATIAVAVPRQGRTGARQQGRCRPPSTHARLRTQPRTHARSRPNPARRLPFLGAADRTAAATWAATSERAASHRGVVCVFLFTCSARGRPDTSTPLCSRCRDHKQGSVIRPRRARLFPRPQNPQVPRGALSRYKRGPQTSAEIPEPRSLDLCRTLSPQEAARPRLELTNGIGVPRVAVTTDHAVEPRGFEPRTSAVQGRRSPG